MLILEYKRHFSDLGFKNLLEKQFQSCIYPNTLFSNFSVDISLLRTK